MQMKYKFSKNRCTFMEYYDERKNAHTIRSIILRKKQVTSLDKMNKNL